MKGEIGNLAFVEGCTTLRARLVQAKALQIKAVESRRYEDLATIAEADQAPIEQAIDVRCEEQTVGTIQPFGGGAAYPPHPVRVHQTKN